MIKLSNTKLTSIIIIEELIYRLKTSCDFQKQITRRI